MVKQNTSKKLFPNAEFWGETILQNAARWTSTRPLQKPNAEMMAEPIQPMPLVELNRIHLQR